MAKLKAKKSSGIMKIESSQTMKYISKVMAVTMAVAPMVAVIPGAAIATGISGIDAASISPDNDYMDIHFSAGVFGDNETHNTPVSVTSFTYDFYQNAGTASTIEISRISQTNGSDLVGGEQTVRVYFNITGIPNGNETVRVKIASNGIYDFGGVGFENLNTAALHLHNPIPTVVTGKAVSSKKVVLEMSRNMESYSISSAVYNDFAFTGTSGTPAFVDNIYISGSQITLYLAGAELPPSPNPTLTFTPFHEADDFSNGIISLPAFTANLVPDKAIPSQVSAEVTGANTIDVTMNRDLTEFSYLDKDDFDFNNFTVINDNGNGSSSYSVTGLSVAGMQAYLTLNKNIEEAHRNLKLSYVQANPGLSNGFVGLQSFADLSVTAYPIAAPTISESSVSYLTDTSARISLTSSKNGQVYYVALPEGEDAPLASEIRAGMYSSEEGSFDYWDNVPVTANANASFLLTGLDVSTAYKVYVVAENLAEDLSQVYPIDLTTKPMDSFGLNGTHVITWGIPNNVHSPFDEPQYVTIDSYDDLYVSDKSANGVLKYNAKGTRLPIAFGAGLFGAERAGQTAVDSQGNLYAVDFSNNRVRKFNAAGVVYVSDLDNYSFDAPNGVAVDSIGNVYVTDAQNRVVKFSPSGQFIKLWETNAGLDHPRSIAIDPDNNVYVSVTGYNYAYSRIIKYDANGQFLLAWGNSGDESFYLDHPTQMAFDSNNDIYVADSARNRILKFTDEGTPIAQWKEQWGEDGSGLGQFNYPTGVAVDSSGNVYVADSGNDRIQMKYAATDAAFKWTPFGGNWTVAGSVYTAGPSEGMEQRLIASNSHVTDFSLEADVEFSTASGDAGFNFRMSSPDFSVEYDNQDAYYVGIIGDSGKAVIGKQMHNWNQLKIENSSRTRNSDNKYHLKVVVRGAEVKVYVDNMVIPKFTYTDPNNTYTSGMIGLRSTASDVTFHNVNFVDLVQVAPDETPPTLVSASTNTTGNEIKLVFSETLYADEPLQTSDFNLTGNGNTVITSVVFDPADTSHKTVKLILSGNIAMADQPAITVLKEAVFDASGNALAENITIPVNNHIIQLSEGFPLVGDITSTSFKVKLNINRTGTVYYLLMPGNTSDASISAADVKNPTNVSGLIDNSSFNIEAFTDTDIAISGLPEETNYKIFYLIQVGDDETEVRSVEANTLYHAPVLSLVRTYDRGAKFTVTSNRSGKIYYLVLDRNHAVPTEKQIKDAYDSNIIGSFIVSENDIDKPITFYTKQNLVNSHDYTLYVVSTDGTVEPNIYDNTLSVSAAQEFRTEASDTIGPKADPDLPFEIIRANGSIENDKQLVLGDVVKFHFDRPLLDATNAVNRLATALNASGFNGKYGEVAPETNANYENTYFITITDTVNLVTNNVVTVPAQALQDFMGSDNSQPVSFKVTDSITPSLTPDTTDNDTDHKIDISFEDTATDWTSIVQSIQDGANTLYAETDYHISSHQITFKDNVLSPGLHSLTIHLAGYQDAVLSQNIYGLFDKNGNSEFNTDLTLPLAGTLNAITLNGNSVGSGNYSIVNNQLTISKSFLTGQDVGNYPINLFYAGGTTKLFSVLVFDSSEAITAINDAIDLGDSSVTLTALQAGSAHIKGLDASKAGLYQDWLAAVKADKQDEDLTAFEIQSAVIAVNNMGHPQNSPHSISFADTNTSRGIIAGNITFVRPADQRDITNYVLFWGNAGDVLPGSFGFASIVKPANSDTTITYSLANQSIPEGATHIIVYSSNHIGTSEGFATTPINDNTAYKTAAPALSTISAVNNLATSDAIFVMGVAMGATVKVYNDYNGGNLIGYTSNIIDGTAVVNINPGFTTSSVYVTVTEAGALESEHTEKTVPLVQSVAPSESNIMLTNNLSGADTVTVAGVPDGATVKVYNAATEGSLIGSATSVSGGTATVNIGAGFTTGSIYVTITDISAYATESERTAKVVIAAQGAAPLAENIMIQNNETGDDALYVSGIPVNATVNVYSSASGDIMIASATNVNSGTANITIAGGFTTESIYITITDIHAGTTESLRTSKVVPLNTTAFTVTSASAISLNAANLIAAATISKNEGHSGNEYIIFELLDTTDSQNSPNSIAYVFHDLDIEAGAGTEPYTAHFNNITLDNTHTYIIKVYVASTYNETGHFIGTKLALIKTIPITRFSQLNISGDDNVIGIDDIMGILSGSTTELIALQDINHDGQFKQADDIRILLDQISPKTTLEE